MPHLYAECVENTRGSQAAPRLRRDAALNRERILDSARQAFAELGVDTSLENIAKTAGVAIGTLYRHFPSRVDLLLAAFQPKFDSFMAVATAALADEDPWSGLSSCLEALCEMQAADRGFTDFVSMRFPASTQTELMHDQVCGVLKDVLSRAKGAKVVRQDLADGDLIAVIWANSRIIEATTDIAPRAWRRQLLLTLEAFRYRDERELDEPPLTDRQLYAAMAKLSKPL